MANLVSPGVSVTVTDESFFLPAAASTVPLLFVATAAEKTQPNGTSPAAGTFEHDVIRTVTSLKQSTELYGIPRFVADNDAYQYHGDSRNEYGLFALNQFLGIGNLAYVIRSNVNLDDDLDSLRDLWDTKVLEVESVLENLVNQFLDEYNSTNQLVPTDLGLVGTVNSIVGGTDYTTGAYTNVPLTGGTGTGATADITVAGGAVTAVTIVQRGTGYTVGDSLSADVADLGGSEIATLTAISSPGSGYVDGSYSGVSLTGGNGSAATADITVAGGVVTVVTLVNGGVGYQVGDALSASNTQLGGSGAGFGIAVATLSATGFTVNVATVVDYRTTVTDSELEALFEDASQEILWDFSSFADVHDDFADDQTASPLSVYGDGYGSAATGTFIGFAGELAAWVAGSLGGTVPTEWTATEAGTTFVAAADDFKYTSQFLTKTRLGANDSARRTKIVTSLQASINSNTDIRGEQYEYNLVLCPGYPEVVDELLALVTDIQEEAFVIADTPMNMDPTEVVAWAATSDRRTSRNVAYYYPHGLASNLDGVNVYIAASGTALRTMTYSDEVSELWFAPAGTRRGLVSGVSQVGYVDGTLGTPTTFVETALNQGQRDNLYAYFTNINPIVFFPGRGIIVWGQKTSAPDASAMDRINVTRLVAYIKRQLRKNTMSFVFEPNDQLTRDNLKAVVDGFLGDLIVRRGLYDFATVCDESNNTPDRVDRNEMYIDIALKPVKAAEFIYIPIRIVATGAEI